MDPKTNQVLNLSCGFWASFYAILAMFNVPIKQALSRDPIVDALRNIVVDYQTNPDQGLSQAVFVNNFRQFLPNIKARLMYHATRHIVSASETKEILLLIGNLAGSTP